MSALTRTGSVTPLLGAVAIRRARRSILAAIVAVVALSTTAHHLAPAHADPLVLGAGGSAPSAVHHAGGAHDAPHHAGLPHPAEHGEPSSVPQPDHAMPVMAMCLGVVLAGFILAYVGAVLRAPRTRRRTRRSRPVGPRTARWCGRAACRDGPPVFLRLQVLRT